MQRFSCGQVVESLVTKLLELSIHDSIDDKIVDLYHRRAAPSWALIGCCAEGGGKLSDASVHGYGHPPDENTFKLSCKNTARIFELL